MTSALFPSPCKMEALFNQLELSGMMMNFNLTYRLMFITVEMIITKNSTCPSLPILATYASKVWVPFFPHVLYDTKLRQL